MPVATPVGMKMDCSQVLGTQPGLGESPGCWVRWESRSGQPEPGVTLRTLPGAAWLCRWVPALPVCSLCEARLFQRREQALCVPSPRTEGLAEAPVGQGP